MEIFFQLMWLLSSVGMCAAARGGRGARFAPTAPDSEPSFAEHWNTAATFVRGLPSAYAKWWVTLFKNDPGHVIVETALILFILYILVVKKTLDLSATAKPKLSEREMTELIADWQPEPLVAALRKAAQRFVDAIPVVEKAEGPFFHVAKRSKPLLNFATFDFLGMSQQPELKEAAEAALNKYGCGSCGPRGFYGTTDAHLKVEEQVSAFMGTENAIMYSDSATTVSSTIPAFAKRGDLLIVDNGCEEPVFTGCNLSRGIVKTFRHNDVADLRRVLAEVRAEDKRLRRNVLEQRRFIVVEGLYRNCGDICPLPELLKLKAEFKYRLVIDESLSFGVLGATGRGVTEHFSVPPTAADFVTVSLAHALASVGGICVGTNEIVDHQRLSAAGYCFSAAAPPFLSASASAALGLLRAQPQLLAQLSENSEYLHEKINGISGLKTTSWSKSPLIHVALEESAKWASDEEREARLCAIAEHAASEGGIAVAVSRYIERDVAPRQPTLRITTNARHTRQQLDVAVAALKAAAKASLK